MKVYIKERKNETHIMNNGMEASILEYRKYQDIDVKFSDNTIVKNKRYSDFKKGRINNPNYNPIK